VSKILVGIGEPDRSRDAIVLASQLARGTDAELVLVNAYPYDDHPSRAANMEYREYLRKDAEQAVDQVLEDGTDVAHTRRTVAEPSPAKALQLLAEQEEAALIVLGSSRHGALGRVLAGTTAERLLHGAPCPVAVAPSGFRDQEPHSIETVAVAYDGSKEAEAALMAATTVAAALGASLKVIEVLDLMMSGTPALMAGPGYIEAPRDVEARANRRLAELVAALPASVSAEGLVAVGDPEAMLAKQSESVDLMIAGSRGYGPHRAVLVGSVSGRLVRDAACPVLVVPRGIEAPLEELFRSRAGTQPV
jgi:nucleotide-binding universal stress UspA family protein